MNKDSVMIAKLEDNSKLMQMLKENQKDTNNTMFTSLFKKQQNSL